MDHTPLNTPTPPAHALQAEDIAAFLRNHPEFFQQHADVFAQLQVPHPYASRAISLGERQILTLRDKIKALEWQLSGFIHRAKGNEKISDTLTTWCMHMLAEDDATQLPRHIVQNLQALFDLPTVVLRLWDLPRLPESEFTAEVSADVRTFAAGLHAPLCGPADNQPVLAWLSARPASLAIVPLRCSAPVARKAHACAEHPLTQQDAPFGLLVLASAEAERFTPDMGTDFLSMLGQLICAALSRLRQGCAMGRQ